MEADLIKLMHVRGEQVVDRDGHPIGSVVQLACEPTGHRAEWLVLRAPSLGLPRLVPVEEAIDQGGTIRVPFSRARVLDAPIPLVPVAPATSECAALEKYYRRSA